MTLEETNNCEIIDELIRQGRSFAMYRNPGEEEPHFLMQTCLAFGHSAVGNLIYYISCILICSEIQGFVC